MNDVWKFLFVFGIIGAFSAGGFVAGRCERTEQRASVAANQSEKAISSEAAKLLALLTDVKDVKGWALESTGGKLHLAHNQRGITVYIYQASTRCEVYVAKGIEVIDVSPQFTRAELVLIANAAQRQWGTITHGLLYDALQ